MLKKQFRRFKKTKDKIKKELEESIAKSWRNENADMQEKVNGCKTNKDAVKAIQAIQKFEEII